MIFHTHNRKSKHVERTAELVNYTAEQLKNEIIEYAKGQISEQEAELLAYKRVSTLDFDNPAEMSVPLDERAKRIVDSYTTNK